MQSDILIEFWGEPIYFGATVLSPAGYDDNPDVSYPTVYQQGHFSLRNPFRYGGDNEFTEAWDSNDFPRFLAVTIQHLHGRLGNFSSQPRGSAPRPGP